MNYKYFKLLLLLGILLFDFVCVKAEDQNNKVSNIDSVWEYEPGEYGRVTFTLFKDGKFIYENTNSKKIDEGVWEYNSDHNQLIISFTSNKLKWDKIFFEDKSFLEIEKNDIGYFNKAEKKVGLIIHESSKDKKKYIGFLGYFFYKK